MVHGTGASLHLSLSKEKKIPITLLHNMGRTQTHYLSQSQGHTCLPVSCRSLPAVLPEPCSSQRDLDPDHGDPEHLQTHHAPEEGPKKYKKHTTHLQHCLAQRFALNHPSSTINNLFKFKKHFIWHAELFQLVC